FSLANRKIVSPAAMCLPPYMVFCAENANVFARASAIAALIAYVMLVLCLFFSPRRLLPLGQRDHLRAFAVLARALAQRVLQVDRDAVFLQEIGEGFIRQFLERRHAVARQLLEFRGGVVVEGDQFAHGRLGFWALAGNPASARVVGS